MEPRFSALLPLLESLGRPSRRALLRWSALTGVSLALLQRKAGAEEGIALEPSRYRALDAATARILPSGEGPGAREAKVMRFLDRQLAGELRPLLPALTACAALLDQWSQRQYQHPYADIDISAQDAILRQLSRGEIPAPGFPQKEAYLALHTLTLEGFLSDPAHGGNDQMIAWRALGVSAPHRRTREEAGAEDGPARGHKLRIIP